MKKYVMDAIIRAVKTFSQTLLAVIVLQAGGGEIPESGIESIDWLGALSLSAVSAVISILMSIIALDTEKDETEPRRAI